MERKEEGKRNNKSTLEGVKQIMKGSKNEKAP